MSATILRIFILAVGTACAMLAYKLWSAKEDARLSAIILGCFALYAIIGAAVWDFGVKP